MTEREKLIATIADTGWPDARRKARTILSVIKARTILIALDAAGIALVPKRLPPEMEDAGPGAPYLDQDEWDAVLSASPYALPKEWP